MRILYTSIALLFIFNLITSAQSISPQVFGSAGNYYAVAGNSLSFTIGESLTTTLTNSNSKITQGFQQPSYTATAITEVENPIYDLSIYPNPASNVITILNNGISFSNNTQLFLIDVLGRRLIEQQLNNKQTLIDLQQVAAGTYFIVIEENGHDSFTHKITKVQ
ncbi:hypothetical protein LBMAG27_12360 [Bacteroidota bacterium]|nr:hypothetical protein LBMAG27_12360 [Bacteroidota bacterium]